MRWKYVLNGNAFEDCITASSMAGKIGYKFFLHKDIMYFRDEISLHVFDTGLREKDLV